MDALKTPVKILHSVRMFRLLVLASTAQDVLRVTSSMEPCVMVCMRVGSCDLSVYFLK